MFRGSQVERDLDDELRYHLERQTAEYVARGLAPDEARIAALRRMGGVDQSKEACRDARGLRWLDDFVQDLRYALRMIRRNPGFTAVVVVSLALGIGANTAIFSAIDAVMLRALPVRDPSQLVMLTWDPTRQTPEQFVAHVHGNSGRVFSTATFEQIRARNDALTDTFAIAGNGEVVNVGFGSGADLAHVQGVSWNYFDGLGVRLALGRGFWLDDDRAGASPVAVVSHRFWLRQLGRDPSIVGKTVAVNGSPLTVIGVTPPEFFGLQPGTGPDLWIPLSVYLTHQREQGNRDDGLSYENNPKSWWLSIVGRLKPDTGRQEALASLQLLFQRSLDPLGTSAAHDDKVPRIDFISVKYGVEELRAQFSTSLFFLMGMVGLVLLIACANVAGLLLARTSARQREIALRLSLGAARSRIMRQLLTESILLAAIGGTTGLLVAFWINSTLFALIPLPLHLSAVVLMFTAATSALTGVAFGLAPAWRGSGIPLFDTVKQSLTAGRAFGQRLASRKVLTAAQVALCLLLLMVAGLFLRTLQKLQTVDLGFERSHLVLFSVRPGLNGYKDARLVAYYEELQQRLQSIPQVRSVGFSTRAPIGEGRGVSGATIPDSDRPNESFRLHRHQVGPGYFDVFGISIVSGRGIDKQDSRTAPKVIVVNETLVRRYFANTNPLGRRLGFTNAGVFEIVGVARDVKYNGLRDDIPPTVYFSYQQFLSVSNYMTFELRADSDASIVNSIRRAALSLDPDVPPVDIETQVEAIDKTLALERTVASLSTWFGALALALACVGLYGTMAFSVARRANEIGVRLALGASAPGIRRMVLRETLVIIAAGLAVGLPLTFSAARLLKGQLFGLAPSDPTTMVLALIVIVTVTMLAGYIPARRASRVDPMIALRCE